MPEPRLYRVIAQHRQHYAEHYVFAENAEVAITAFDGEVAEEAARRGLLRAYPVPAMEGGEAMTRAEALDAIEARIGARGAGASPEVAEPAADAAQTPELDRSRR